MTTRTLGLVLSPLPFYVLALNPYLRPDHFDTVIYYDLACSLSKSGTYETGGEPIYSFPPGFPLMLALLFRAGFESVWTGKIVVLVMAALGMVFTYLLLQREQYRFPKLVTVTTWMLPVVMSVGTSTMSDVPYLTLSLVFLYLLSLQRAGKRTTIFALAVGALLGWAALTRWMGVLLGVAVVAQAVRFLARDRQTSALRRITPELVTALVGAALVFSWFFAFVGKADRLPFLGTPPTSSIKPAELIEDSPPQWLEPWLEWNPRGVEWELLKKQFENDYFYKQSKLTRSLDQASNLLFQKRELFNLAHLPPSHPLRVLFFPPLVLVGIGVFWRFRSGKAGPSDWYAVSLLGILTVVGWHPVRYWVAAAPFLVAYCIDGGRTAWDYLTRRTPSACRAAGPVILAAGWILLMVSIAADRLFLPNDPHGALCYPLSPRSKDFYISPDARDLFRVCEAIDNDGAAGPIVVVGTSPRGLISHFTDNPVVFYPPSAPPVYLVVARSHQVPPALIAAQHLTLLVETPSLRVYRVGSPSRAPGE